MGKLQINGDLLLSGSISFKTSNCITPAFSVVADTNAYGQNLLIGAGGNTVIGGGESARELFSNLGILNEENLYLAGDNVFIYTNCNDVTQKKLVMSLNADGTIGLPNGTKINTDGTFSGKAAGLYRVNHLTTEEQVNNFQAPNTLQYCTISADYSPIGNDGVLICAGWSSGKYGAQIWIDDGGGSGGMKIRSFGADNGVSWNAWQTVLTNINYSSWAMPLSYWNWSGQSGQPTWLWGGNEYGSYYVYNPSNFNVNGASKLNYPGQLSADTDVDNFNSALTIQAGFWNGPSILGMGNGIIINGGWTSTNYGFQLAFDDDPTYIMGLRQRNGDGWSAWKRIPMADGTGASGTWGISITGSSSSAASSSYTTYDGTNILYAGWSNEVNFGGSNSSTTIFFGYRAVDSKSIPTNFVFGGSSGTATITAANFTGTWQGNSPSAFASASHSHSYVPLSGGTMTGKLQVNNLIFSYNYTNSSNAVAFMFDKPGSYYTGIGANGSSDTIQFGPCNADGTWVTNYAQHWAFRGTIRPGCIILTNDQWTGYGESDPESAGLSKVVGRVYFKIG